MLELESRKWPSQNDLNEVLADDKIIPNSILHHKEYLEKLQRMAKFAEQGDYKNLEKVINNEDFIQEKNTMLTPIYRDLKHILRKMANTEEYNILRQFKHHV